jgi:hypothetical protein
MRSTLLLICSICVSSICSGCISQQDAAATPQSPARENEAVPERHSMDRSTENGEPIVFRGVYRPSTGPCIELGEGRLGMPFIDTFEVVEVLEGDLATKNVHVRAMTEGGPRYPTELAADKIYTLRFVPSAETSEQMRELEKEDGRFLWIDGNEIEEYEAPK